MGDLLIRGGTALDGTGAQGLRANVRVRGHRIAEIAPDLRPEGGEKTADTSGAFVATGFIDHTTTTGRCGGYPRSRTC